ncbi:MAG: hypothetical protein KGZ84_01195 [Erysipelotrichia bacterium]|nr:hypothetical protein [Erysipelotrichia bacterium]
MIRMSLWLAHVFLWLPMTLTHRKMKKSPLSVNHTLVRMWAVLFLKIAKIKVKVKYRNHIPLSSKTLICVDDRPFMSECLLVGLQSECVFYQPRHTSYGLPQKWLNVVSVNTLEEIPTYCIMFTDDLTQHDLDVLSTQNVQIMKIKAQEVDTILIKPTKINFECGIPLSVEESSSASLEVIHQL